MALDVETAVLNREEAAARVGAAADAVAQAEENLRIARELYGSGLGTNTQVLDAETLRVAALTNRDNAALRSAGGRVPGPTRDWRTLAGRPPCDAPRRARRHHGAADNGHLWLRDRLLVGAHWGRRIDSRGYNPITAGLAAAVWTPPRLPGRSSSRLTS